MPSSVKRPQVDSPPWKWAKNVFRPMPWLPTTMTNQNAMGCLVDMCIQVSSAWWCLCYKLRKETGSSFWLHCLRQQRYHKNIGSTKASCKPCHLQILYARCVQNGSDAYHASACSTSSLPHSHVTTSIVCRSHLPVVDQYARSSSLQKSLRNQHDIQTIKTSLSIVQPTSIDCQAPFSHS